MSFFACAIQTDGGSVAPSFRAMVERSRYCSGTRLTWLATAGFSGTFTDHDGARPSVARVGSAIGMGTVRLDNRAEVANWIGGRGGAAGDLELATRILLMDEGARIDRLLGDFALVVWNPSTRRLVAARDTFGVRTLYYVPPRNGMMTFSSRAELLASGDEYDVQYLAERISHCSPTADRTVYSGVCAVPPAASLRLRRGEPVVTTYWSARDAQAGARAEGSPQDQCEAFRALLMESVRLRLSGSADTWSHLSGGLDSSSVVSVAQWLERSGKVSHGLAGTVTYTDSHGVGADEKEYSDAVVQHVGVRNELIPHRVELRSILLDPPLLDQPNQPHEGAARDAAAATFIRRAGGRVLLTGAGGDGLVMGTMFFFADWMVSGRMWQAWGEMARRAAIGRVSVWEVAYQNAVMPLVPACLQRALSRADESAAPPWIERALDRRFELTLRNYNGMYPGRVRHKYTDAVAQSVAALSLAVPHGAADDVLDVRHPYLHRPLAELALRLGPEMCVRPHARKWILREAMRGILPESVRTRVGKATADGLNAWSLVHEATHVDRLLHDPILAQVGCIDVSKLRRAVADVRKGSAEHQRLRGLVSSTLESELWLQLRSGRWAADDSQFSRTVNKHGPNRTTTFTGQ